MSYHQIWCVLFNDCQVVKKLDQTVCTHNSEKIEEFLNREKKKKKKKTKAGKDSRFKNSTHFVVSINKTAVVIYPLMIHALGRGGKDDLYVCVYR